MIAAMVKLPFYESNAYIFERLLKPNSICGYAALPRQQISARTHSRPHSHPPKRIATKKSVLCDFRIKWFENTAVPLK